MKIHHLRNASCVLETGTMRILIDPMLSAKGELPPFSVIRFQARRNPIVDLPAESDKILQNITHCLITHSRTFGIKALQHTDHLDAKGEAFLVKHKIPVLTGKPDVEYLKNYGMRVNHGLECWRQQPFGEGSIMAVPAMHGHGWNRQFMANGVGFYLEFVGEPSVYIAGDTVYTADVERALQEYKPDVVILPAGSAQLDIGPPILMAPDELLTCIKKVPGKVVLNHLEALNHCPVTRLQLETLMEQNNLQERVFIPDDGQTIEI